MPEHEEKLKAKITQTFPSNQDKHESLFEDLEQVMKRKNLVRLFFSKNVHYEAGKTVRDDGCKTCVMRTLVG